MIRNNKKTNDFVYRFSEEKLKEFSGMSLRARLQWLEEANMFINKAIGFNKRALFDKRFKIFTLKTAKK